MSGWQRKTSVAVFVFCGCVLMLLRNFHLKPETDFKVTGAPSQATSAFPDPGSVKSCDWGRCFGSLKMLLSICNPMAAPWEFPAILPPCHDPKDYPVCECTEITTVGLQNSITHKDTEALFSRFLYYRLLQIAISKARILMSNKVSMFIF